MSAHILAVIGSLAGAAAQAAYVMSDNATRGSVTISGTSQGSFTFSPSLYSFRGAVTTSDPAVYEAGLAEADPTQTYYFSPEPLTVAQIRIADGLVDRFAPQGTIISGSYPSGTGDLSEPLIVVDYYGPDGNPDNPYVKHYLIDGGISLTYSFQTQTAGVVRYSFTILGVNPDDAMSYSYVTSGVITFGVDGANDVYSDSYVLRSSDNQFQIVGKVTGAASAIPEPSAYALWLGCASTLGALGARRPRFAKSRA